MVTGEQHYRNLAIGFAHEIDDRRDAAFIQQSVLLDRCLPLAGLASQIEGVPGANRRRRQANIGSNAGVGDEQANPFGGVLAAFGKRALFIRAKRGIPIRFSVPKDEQRSHGPQR